MFATGFSRAGAAAIFTLAYHVKKPGTDYKEYLFGDVSPYFNIEDKKYIDYSYTKILKKQLFMYI